MRTKERSKRLRGSRRDRVRLSLPKGVAMSLHVTKCDNCDLWRDVDYYEPADLLLCEDCWPDREAFRRPGESVERFQRRVLGVSMED